MAAWGDMDVPAYLEQTWDEAQAPQMTGGASQPNADQVVRIAAVIIIVALIGLWAMGYWFKKG